MFKHMIRKSRYLRAMHKFYPKYFQFSQYFDSPHNAIEPHMWDLGLSFDTGKNDYNTFSESDLKKFYFGNLLYANTFADAKILEPTRNSSPKYKKAFEQAKGWLLVEIALMISFAKRRLVTYQDVKKALGVNNTVAIRIFNAPEICSFRIADSPLKNNISNAILSDETVSGYKKVNHNEIAHAIGNGMHNYYYLKWNKEWHIFDKGYHSTDDLIDFSIKQSAKEIGDIDSYPMEVHQADNYPTDGIKNTHFPSKKFLYHFLQSLNKPFN